MLFEFWYTLLWKNHIKISNLLLHAIQSQLSKSRLVLFLFFFLFLFPDFDSNLQDKMLSHKQSVERKYNTGMNLLPQTPHSEERHMII